MRDWQDSAHVQSPAVAAIVPVPFRAEFVPRRARAGDLDGSGRAGLPLRHAHRRRKKPLLPTAGAGPRRPDAGRLAADRADERPGRSASGVGPAGEFHQQHALDGGAVRPARSHGGRRVSAGLRGAGAVSQRAISRRGSGGGRQAAGGRRGPLHQRVGARFSPRLRPARPFPPPAGQSDDDRPDGHGHRPRAARHRRAARPARAARPSSPASRGRTCSTKSRCRAASGRSPTLLVEFLAPHARLGHHLHLDAQAGRGGGRDDRRADAPPHGRLSCRDAARPAPQGPGRLHARAAARSSWPPTPSAWASTRPTCGSSSTTTFPAASRRIIRRRAAPAATAPPRTASCSTTPPTATSRSTSSTATIPAREHVEAVYEFLCEHRRKPHRDDPGRAQADAQPADRQRRRGQLRANSRRGRRAGTPDRLAEHGLGADRQRFAHAGRSSAEAGQIAAQGVAGGRAASSARGGRNWCSSTSAI